MCINMCIFFFHKNIDIFIERETQKSGKNERERPKK